MIAVYGMKPNSKGQPQFYWPGAVFLAYMPTLEAANELARTFQPSSKYGRLATLRTSYKWPADSLRWADPWTPIVIGDLGQIVGSGGTIVARAVSRAAASTLVPALGAIAKRTGRVAALRDATGRPVFA